MIDFVSAPISNYSTMKVIRVNETAQLDPTLSTESGNYDRTFVFFFGAEMEETSESWCPDCVIGK